MTSPKMVFDALNSTPLNANIILSVAVLLASDSLRSTTQQSAIDQFGEDAINTIMLLADEIRRADSF